MTTVLIDAIGWTVLGFLWQGALIGAGAALILLALRAAHPRYRYATASAALLACLVWPLADLATRADAAWSSDAPTEVVRSGRPAIGADADADVFAATVDSAVGAATIALPYVVLLWLGGVALLGLRTGAGLAWIARSAKGAAALQWERRAAQLGERMGITRRVRVRLAPGLDSQVAAGWRDPLILLPAPLAAGMPASPAGCLAGPCTGAHPPP